MYMFALHFEIYNYFKMGYLTIVEEIVIHEVLVGLVLVLFFLSIFSIEEIFI